MLRYDNLANPGLSQGNPSSKLLWLTNLWVDNIQFPAYHEKPVKTNDKQSIIAKKFILTFRGKLHQIAVIPTRHCHTPRTEYHRGNIKTLRGENQKFTKNCQWFNFSMGWTKFCKSVGEVKNPNAFHLGVILRTRFSPGNSLGYWNRVC